MNPTTYKVGRFTVAIGLVALGIGLLVDNLASYGATSIVLKFWPALLIGIGVEYLVRTALLQRSGEAGHLRFDVGGVILLLLVFLLGTGVNAFRQWGGLDFGPINLGVGPSVSRTESKSVPVGNAKELKVDLNVGSISLQPATEGGEVRVEATYTIAGLLDQDEAQRRLDSIQLQVEGGNDVNVSVDTPLSLNNTSVRFTVYAPPGLKVTAETSAGSIDVSGYKGDLDLTSRVGRIEVNASSGSLRANNNSGSISVDSFTGPIYARTNVGRLALSNTDGALELNSSTGSIEVREYRGGKLSAETGTGRIQAETSAALADLVFLKTNTGTIEFTAPRESSMRVSAQTRTGSMTMPDFVSVSRQGTSSSGAGSSGDGKHAVTLEAGTGAVRFYVK